MTNPATGQRVRTVGEVFPSGEGVITKVWNNHVVVRIDGMGLYTYAAEELEAVDE